MRHTEPRPRSLLILSALALFAVASVASASNAQDPSLLDRARNGTTRAANATGKALDRAADRTGAWLKQVPKKVGTAAHKTDAALNRAADKVGLPHGGSQSPARSDNGGLKAGPRPTP